MDLSRFFPAPGQLKGLAPLVSKAEALDREAAAVGLVLALTTPDGEQRDHPDRLWDVQQLLDRRLVVAFHRRGVVAEGFGHPHQSGEGNHHMAVDPDAHVGTDATDRTRLRAK